MTRPATNGRAKTARPTPGATRATPTPQAVGCTGARLRRLSRRVTAFYEHHLRITGLTLSQYSLLVQLSEQPQSLTALADRMELDRTTLTRNLQPLLDQGLVGESSGADARQRLFVLSAEGVLVRSAARKQWRQAQLALEEQLGGAFVANLHTQLEEALSRLKPVLPGDN